MPTIRPKAVTLSSESDLTTLATITSIPRKCLKICRYRLRSNIELVWGIRFHRSNFKSEFPGFCSAMAAVLPSRVRHIVKRIALNVGNMMFFNL
jgi:hypothetical protein